MKCLYLWNCRQLELPYQFKILWEIQIQPKRGEVDDLEPEAFGLPKIQAALESNAVVGDPLYGRISRARIKDLPGTVVEALRSFSRQALHATLLAFNHPETGERLSFESALPKDMNELCDILESI